LHLDVAILGKDRTRLPPCEAGEICFRAAQSGPWAHVYTGPLGYWKISEATEALLSGGWVHTGDIGTYDQNGEFFILDRRNDLIIRGGANVYPAEVERALRMDPRVRDCAVVGKRDARLGEVVVAFVETFEPAGQGLFQELESACRKEIAAYKVPVEWVLVDALPRNAMGKVTKNTLRESLRQIA
jgi:acyl-CoA synthetase (AMP-forming)/AMP-acid ligase II